jgi:hypothetical protein
LYSDRQVSVRFPAVANDEQGDRGVLATLHLEIIEEGTGVLYPDPRYHATTVSDELFLGSMCSAQTCADFPSPDADEPVDVRWRIEFEWSDLQPSEITGPSSGGAFAVGLMLLKRARLGPPVYWPETHVVMATVEDEGRLDWVGKLSDKIEAIERRADTIDYVVVPDDNPNITIPGVDLIPAGTVKQLLLEVGDDLMGGEPGPEFAADVISGHAEALESALFFDEPTGAVEEERRLDNSPPFLFTEVTGFAVQDLVFMYRSTGNEAFLERACRAADWLTTEATRGDGADTHQGAWSDGWCLTRDYIGGVRDTTRRRTGRGSTPSKAGTSSASTTRWWTSASLTSMRKRTIRSF